MCQKSQFWQKSETEKDNGWSVGEGLHLLYKICWKTKMVPPRILAPHPKFSQNLDWQKLQN